MPSVSMIFKPDSNALTQAEQSLLGLAITWIDSLNFKILDGLHGQILFFRQDRRSLKSCAKMTLTP
jgi:hypothetical protein